MGFRDSPTERRDSFGARLRSTDDGSGGGSAGGPFVEGVRFTENTTEADIEGSPIDRQINEGGEFVGSPRVPGSVVAGTEFTVTGTVINDCPACLITDRSFRVVVESPLLTENRVQNLGPISGPTSETRDFRIRLPAPSSPDQVMPVTIKVQRKPPSLSGWNTDASETFQVNVVTEAQQRKNRVLQFAPWVAGGAGGGLLLARNRPVKQQAIFAAAGGAAGAGGKVVAEEAIPRNVSVDVESFLLWGGVLGVAAYALDQVTELTGPEPLAPSPSEIRDRARGAAGRVRS